MDDGSFLKNKKHRVRDSDLRFDLAREREFYLFAGRVNGHAPGNGTHAERGQIFDFDAARDGAEVLVLEEIDLVAMNDGRR